MQFSDRLALAMRIRAVTQSVLARRLNTSQSTVSRWFTGGAPQAATVEKIARALSVSVSWLSAGIGEGPSGDPAPPHAPVTSEVIGEDPTREPDQPDLSAWSKLELIKLARLLATIDLGRKELLHKVFQALERLDSKG